jgi:hypothetical protein
MGLYSLKEFNKYYIYQLIRMKTHSSKMISVDGNIIKITEKYDDNDILCGLVTDIFYENGIQISSESKVFYEDSSQIRFEIFMNYEKDYTEIRSYYLNGTIKGESRTINKEYVFHKVYNEDGTVKNEMRTLLTGL